MAMLDEIGAYLETQGVGTVHVAGASESWPIYKGGFQEESDNAIALAEGPGDAPQDQMGSTVGSVVFENPSLVVQVRSKSYPTARTKAQGVWDKLHKYSGALGSTSYLLIMGRQTPFPYGRDDKGRWIIGCNYDVSKEK